MPRLLALGQGGPNPAAAAAAEDAGASQPISRISSLSIAGLGDPEYVTFDERPDYFAEETPAPLLRSANSHDILVQIEGEDKLRHFEGDDEEQHSLLLSLFKGKLSMREKFL